MGKIRHQGRCHWDEIPGARDWMNEGRYGEGWVLWKDVVLRYVI